MRATIVALAGLCLATPACAQSDLFSPSTFGGVIDARTTHGDAETSWVDEGFGKTRFGDGQDGLVGGVLEWRPKLAWSLSAVVDAAIQPDLEKKLDLNEAYLLFKPLGSGGTRWQARLGFFYPPVSLEHDGKAWTTTRTITPSAINSWIGEEVFGGGLEVSAKRTIADQDVGLTLGVTETNDTAGTLLSLRGWSLNDAKATLRGEYGLPPFSTFISYVQDKDTYPVKELDYRAGYYVRVDWSPNSALRLNAIYYNNQGDMEGVSRDLQWSWYTRFANAGLQWQPAENTEVLAQAMTGVTRMGYASPHGRWVNVDFESAYLLGTQSFGANAVTGRVDYFRNSDQADPFYGNLDEHGWAGTLAYRRTFSDHAQFFLEALRIDSDRPERALAGDAPRQRETQFQALVRFNF